MKCIRSSFSYLICVVWFGNIFETIYLIRGGKAPPAEHHDARAYNALDVPSLAGRAAALAGVAQDRARAAQLRGRVDESAAEHTHRDRRPAQDPLPAGHVRAGGEGQESLSARLLPGALLHQPPLQLPAQ